MESIAWTLSECDNTLSLIVDMLATANLLTEHNKTPEGKLKDLILLADGIGAILKVHANNWRAALSSVGKPEALDLAEDGESVIWR